MQPIIPAALLPSLRAIIPDGLATTRGTERQKARNRAAEGRYETNYTKEGVRAANQEKRAQAQAMRTGGASFRQIAEQIGVSYESVRKWCKGVN
ncbi:MAG: replication protein, partial [Acidithiobacillus sp.]|nr:replication protein [Acidithiobacillus sp.]